MGEKGAERMVKLLRGKSCPQSCSESRVPEHHLEHEWLQGLSAPFPSCQFSQTQETQRTVMCTPRAQLVNSRHETSKWAWSCTHHKSNSLVLNLPWSLHIWNCPNSRILEIKRCERETTPTCLTLWHTKAPMFYGMFYPAGFTSNVHLSRCGHWLPSCPYKLKCGKI